MALNDEALTVGRFLNDYRADPMLWQSRPAYHGEDGDRARTSKLLEEVGEVQMALLNGGLAEELADCFIILLDIAYCNDIDIDHALQLKLQELQEKWNDS